MTDDIDREARREAEEREAAFYRRFPVPRRRVLEQVVDLARGKLGGAVGGGGRPERHPEILGWLIARYAEWMADQAAETRHRLQQPPLRFSYDDEPPTERQRRGGALDAHLEQWAVSAATGVLRSLLRCPRPKRDSCAHCRCQHPKAAFNKLGADDDRQEEMW
jgi:hypothetical protein